MEYRYNDGGRCDAGFSAKHAPGDCATRAVAIATGKTYQEVYDAFNLLSKSERTGKRKRGRSNSRLGVYPRTIKKYMTSIGWRWTPTMFIGSGCKVHLRDYELPRGRLVVSVSKHLTAVLDGVIYDIYDPSRAGNRCVYGYFIQIEQ